MKKLTLNEQNRHKVTNSQERATPDHKMMPDHICRCGAGSRTSFSSFSLFTLVLVVIEPLLPMSLDRITPSRIGVSILILRYCNRLASWPAMSRLLFSLVRHDDLELLVDLESFLNRLLEDEDLKVAASEVQQEVSAPQVFTVFADG